MSAMIYDPMSQAFVEAETPMKFDTGNQSWTDTTGLAYNPEAGAWEEKWSAINEYYIEDFDNIDSAKNMFDNDSSTAWYSHRDRNVYHYGGIMYKNPRNINVKSITYHTEPHGGFGTYYADIYVQYTLDGTNWNNIWSTVLNQSYGSGSKVTSNISTQLKDVLGIRVYGRTYGTETQALAIYDLTLL